MERDQTFDVARGIAIILIVLGHVLRGLSAAGLVDAAVPWYEEVDTAVYLVHLAVFFLISGLFMGRAVDRDGAPFYLRRRLVLIAWLFVVWTLLQGMVKVATGSLANTPVTAESITSEFWIPQSQLWFLPTLATMTVVAMVAAPWRSRLRSLVGVGLAATLSFAVRGLSGRWSFTMGMGLLVFFMLGAALGAPRLSAALKARSALALGVGCAAVYGSVIWAWDPTPPSTMFWSRTVASVTLGVVAATAGTWALLALSRVLALTAATRSLAFLGRRSLEIFLAHIIFASGTRILLQQVGIFDTAVHVAAGLVVGVVGPVLVAHAAERLHVHWLFRAPGRQDDQDDRERRVTTSVPSG